MSAKYLFLISSYVISIWWPWIEKDNLEWNVTGIVALSPYDLHSSKEKDFFFSRLSMSNDDFVISLNISDRAAKTPLEYQLLMQSKDKGIASLSEGSFFSLYVYSKKDNETVPANDVKIAVRVKYLGGRAEVKIDGYIQGEGFNLNIDRVFFVNVNSVEGKGYTDYKKMVKVGKKPFMVFGTMKHHSSVHMPGSHCDKHR